MDEDTVATTADFLFRYMLVRHLRIGGPPPSSLLADEIRWGVRAIDHIDIDPEANPPLTTDSAADDFFRAIVRGDDNAMPGIPPETRRVPWNGRQDFYRSIPQPMRCRFLERLEHLAAWRPRLDTFSPVTRSDLVPGPAPGAIEPVGSWPVLVR